MLRTLLKKIDLLITLLLEEKELRKQERDNKEREYRDEELREYAKKHIRKEPVTMMTSINDFERPVNTKARIAVPYGLSNNDKVLLEDFYNKR